MLWVGAVTKDTGFGLTKLTFQITHATDADTNAEREFLFDELKKGGVIGDIRSYKTGDQLVGEQVNRYVTDGDVAVADLGRGADVEDRLVDLLAGERPSPGRHEGRKSDPRAAAPDHVRELRVGLLLLERRVREVARMRIEIERVEAIARAGLTVAGLAVMLEGGAAEPELIGGQGRLGGGRGGFRGRLAGAGRQDEEQGGEASQRLHFAPFACAAGWCRVAM